MRIRLQDSERGP